LFTFLIPFRIFLWSQFLRWQPEWSSQTAGGPWTHFGNACINAYRNAFKILYLWRNIIHVCSRCHYIRGALSTVSHNTPALQQYHLTEEADTEIYIFYENLRLYYTAFLLN
jgi:hypothetical protein